MSQSIIAAQDDFREMLKQSSELLNEIRWGVDGYLDRIDEMRGNFPGGGGSEGGRSKGSYSDPTSSAGGKRDPGAAELAEFRKKALKVWRDVLDFYAVYQRNDGPRTVPPKMDDPGCVPCSSLPLKLPNGAPADPRHWCEYYCKVNIVTEARRSRKGKEVITERVRVCFWCYRFFRRNERLPDVYEVAAHARGDRVRVSA